LRFTTVARCRVERQGLNDEANLAALTEDGAGVQLYITTGDSPPEVRRLEEPTAIVVAAEPRLIDIVPGPERGLRSGLSCREEQG
jgi:hypothetical protein